MPEPRCPICRRPVPPAPPGRRGSAPFCSERCRQVDLGRWLTGSYALPAVEDDDEDGREG